MGQNYIISSNHKQPLGLDQEKTGSFSNEDDDGDENIPYKVNSCFLKLLNSSNVGEFFWGCILKDCTYVSN